MNKDWEIWNRDGKYCLVSVYRDSFYIFRYAYETIKEAEEVLKRLKMYFGLPAGIEMDLATNYWRIKRNASLSFLKRTSQKNSWYIPEPKAKS